MYTLKQSKVTWRCCQVSPAVAYQLSFLLPHFVLRMPTKTLLSATNLWTQHSYAMTFRLTPSLPASGCLILIANGTQNPEAENSLL